ncbi:MAG: deoxynucleoside kinase [Anaerolineae bacterium]|nr:deoxynucleoside kinase [Anaerolineae bacterium]
MTRHFVAIAGNVGVGKSTLTACLAEELNWLPFYEAVADNPYLEDFYQDMARWSFHSQVFFLSRRFRHHYSLSQSSQSVVQDRCVYEDAEIFERNLYLQGWMSPRDHACYQDLYESLRALLPPPDLVVYLRASPDTLLARIARRGRDYERDIERSYLEQLNELYDEWATGFDLCPVLTVPCDRLDFVASEADRRLIIDRIVATLGGRQLPLFPGEKLRDLG